MKVWKAQELGNDWDEEEIAAYQTPPLLQREPTPVRPLADLVRDLVKIATLIARDVEALEREVLALRAKVDAVETALDG